METTAIPQSQQPNVAGYVVLVYGVVLAGLAIVALKAKADALQKLLERKARDEQDKADEEARRTPKERVIAAYHAQEEARRTLHKAVVSADAEISRKAAEDKLYEDLLKAHGNGTPLEHAANGRS